MSFFDKYYHSLHCMFDFYKGWPKEDLLFEIRQITWMI